MLRKLFLLILVGAGSLLMAKPQAPVTIQAKVGASSTAIKLTFNRASDLVDIEVWGANGLTVYGNKNLVTNGTYTAGQTVEFKVSHSSDPGHHDLVVSVHGEFEGSRGSKVSSFTIGDKTPPATHDKVTTDATGRPIIEMRGNRK